jgi:hypothetical protein
MKVKKYTIKDDFQLFFARYGIQILGIRIQFLRSAGSGIVQKEYGTVSIFGELSPSVYFLQFFLSESQQRDKNIVD